MLLLRVTEQPSWVVMGGDVERGAATQEERRKLAQHADAPGNSALI